MEINQFSIYSTLSSKKNSDEDALTKILEQAKNFEEIDAIDEAKKYLREVWGIKDNIRNYPLCDKCILNVVDSSKAFCISLVHDEEDMTYYYQK